MSDPVYIVGLDIGTTKIACIVGEKMPNGKIEIRGYGKTDSCSVWSRRRANAVWLLLSWGLRDARNNHICIPCH